MKLAQLSKCFVAVSLAGAVAVGCGKKDEEPQAVPTPSGTPASVPAEPPPAANTDAGAAAVDAAAAPPVNPTPVTPKPAGGNIDACCSAISAIKTSGRPVADKQKAATAAVACAGIAKRVKDGASSRADGLTQVKALLQGVNVPECN